MGACHPQAPEAERERERERENERLRERERQRTRERECVCVRERASERASKRDLDSRGVFRGGKCEL